MLPRPGWPPGRPAGRPQARHPRRPGSPAEPTSATAGEPGGDQGAGGGAGSRAQGREQGRRAGSKAGGRAQGKEQGRRAGSKAGGRAQGGDREPGEGQETGRAGKSREPGRGQRTLWHTASATKASSRRLPMSRRGPVRTGPASVAGATAVWLAVREVSVNADRGVEADANGRTVAGAGGGQLSAQIVHRVRAVRHGAQVQLAKVHLCPPTTNPATSYFLSAC